MEEEFYKLKEVHILLVEDNKMNVLIAQKIMEKWQINVTVAYNGQEALDVFSKEKFDLILMDIQMPILDGIETTKKIREKDLSVPIIALTAFTDDQIISSTKTAGVNDILTKPFMPKSLYKTLVRYIVDDSYEL